MHDTPFIGPYHPGDVVAWEQGGPRTAQEFLADVWCLAKSLPDATDRYLVVEELMKLEMQNWKDKDLKWASRRMDNIASRLDIARGGRKTQQMQKEVIDLLEEIIKKMEGG
jgi:hypothetical protein